MELFETEKPVQQALLIGVNTGEYDAEASMEELCELAETAGAKVAGTMLQNMQTINGGTYLGKGKLEEAAEFCKNHEVDLVIVNDELSGAQLRNLEAELSTDVVDRTTLILDIFAQRARTNEGKLQVELAQQKYLLPRLIGAGKKLSRLGGGIGTRGPGETKLESDRRHIRRRITALEGELEELTGRRARMRQARSKRDVPTVAIVGYTNVGKSTLLNRLTDAGVLAKDQLFATLDPTARELSLPEGRSAILVDTVGLLERLPHQLIQAFRSTLEEASEADLILNLCDISADRMEEQLAVTNELLDELGCGEIPRLTVYNKCDLLAEPLENPPNEKSVCISAKSGDGLEVLLKRISDLLYGSVREIQVLIPYAQGSLLNRIRTQGKVLLEEFLPEGTALTVQADSRLQLELAGYIR